VRRLLVPLFLVVSLAAAACGDDTQGPDITPQKREHEILTERPSGFWTSNKKAEGGSYRWRLMGIGIALLAITGTGITLLIKKANAEREARNAAGVPRDPKS
jgi:hypothetical protein